MNFEEDNKFSDNCIDSKCLKEHIIKSKLFVSYKGYTYFVVRT